MTLSELNVSNNYATKDNGNYDGKTDMSGVIAISDAIPTMGALTSLDVSNNALCGIIVIDGNEYGTYDASGVTALADAIRKHQ